MRPKTGQQQDFTDNYFTDHIHPPAVIAVLTYVQHDTATQYLGPLGPSTFLLREYGMHYLLKTLFMRRDYQHSDVD